MSKCKDERNFIIFEWSVRMNSCIFCNIINGTQEATVIYEDELIIGFMDIEPINEGHVLLVTKAHKLDLDELTIEEMNRLMIISQIIVKVLKESYKPNGYSIMQNGGEFNDIGHYHLHIFPRYQNDGFNWTFGDTKKHNIDTTGKFIELKIKEKMKITSLN